MSQGPPPITTSIIDYGRPEQGDKNTIGLVGFILVMIGVVGFCFGPALLLGVAGTILCAIGVRKQPRSLALAGLIVGIIETLVFVVVVVILGLIIGGGLFGAKLLANVATTINNGAHAHNAVEHYRAMNGVLPDKLEDCSEIGSYGVDGWGHPFRYTPDVTAGTFKLTSDGADGKPGTGDDVDVSSSTTQPTTQSAP
jgi:type II secretory pathway pseudopilin PulG